MLRRAHSSVRLLVSVTLAIAVLLVLYEQQALRTLTQDLSSSRSSHSDTSNLLSTSLSLDTDSSPEEADPDTSPSTSHAADQEDEDNDAAHRTAVHDAKAHAGALSKRVIVASLRSEDTQWTETELPAGWEPWVYVVDDAGAARAAPINKGREAGVFLWYLYSQYEQLAETNVFLHAHRAGYPQAWHVDNEAHSNPLSVRRLRLDTVQRQGYVNLRCMPVPGCPADMQPLRSPADPDKPAETALRKAWPALFPDDAADIPEIIAAPCCSQFAVSREQVHRRPQADYERFYAWIRDTHLPDDVSGRVFEYLWHIIFGQEPVACPELENCYCDVYGDGCLDGIL